MGSDESNPLGVGLRVADERQWGTTQLDTCLRVARLSSATEAGNLRRRVPPRLWERRQSDGAHEETPAPTIGDRGFSVVLQLRLDPWTGPTALFY